MKINSIITSALFAATLTLGAIASTNVANAGATKFNHFDAPYYGTSRQEGVELPSHAGSPGFQGSHATGIKFARKNPHAKRFQSRRSKFRR